MSSYENVVAEKLRLKGKPLDARGGSITKKKKHRKGFDQLAKALGHDQMTGQTNMSLAEITGLDLNRQNHREDDQDDRLTEAEKCYLERWQKIELQRLAKIAKKSHRDRIQEFNQLSEHYDIPKVGPG